MSISESAVYLGTALLLANAKRANEKSFGDDVNAYIVQHKLILI